MSSAVKTCIVDLNNGRLKLDCRTGMTLFAALRTNKIFLPTGCGAKGLCGQCRVRVLSGETNPHTESETTLLSATDLANGMRLGCQLRLTGDMAIEVSEPVLHAKLYQATVSEIAPLTHDIKRFSFVLDECESAPHKAGQFLNLMMEVPEQKAQPIRCFSFATSSAVSDHIDTIIRLNPRGVLTPHLFNNVKAGDTAAIYAPFGEFRLSDINRDCIWIAGGSGLSPFLGMIQDLMDKGNNDRKIHLFFGAVRPADLYYVDFFNDISAKCPWFKFTPALSGDERTSACQEYGLITDVVAKYVKDASTSEGYLCGSPGMIGACIKVLTERGMPRENISFDRF